MKGDNILNLLVILFAWMACFSLTGCAGTPKWQEEVQLSDNRVIVIDREILREGGGDELAFNRGGSKPKEYRIRFADPNGTGKMIEWRSTKSSKTRWPEIPLILDVESRQSIIYSVVFVSETCEAYSKYILKDDLWSEEPLPEMFPQRQTNLFLKLGAHMPSFVDLETKQKINKDKGYAKSLRQVGPTRKICGL